MKKIIYSMLTIVVAVAAVVGSTGAFFSDTERASGNTFAAGVIDLKVDNESYYNGNRCEDVDKSEEVENWQWQGPSPYPEPGTPCTTSWLLDDLSNGYLFFNFTDLKPDDEGEDTISLHVGTNDAWACMDVSLTSNDDMSSNEPELLVDDPDVADSWDGELAQTLEFIWWADDGDNVYEEGENVISEGVRSLSDLALDNGPFSVALADSLNNVWSEEPSDPLDADVTHYIGKAWCFGTLDASTPIQQDDLNTSGPQERGTGVLCDGTELGNETQTDAVTLDIAFRTLQSRGTPEFTCDDGGVRFAQLTVLKQVNNDHGGDNVETDFPLFVHNGIAQTNVTHAVVNNLVAGTYSVQEQGVTGYQLIGYSGDCDPVTGVVTLAEGESKTCTVINEDIQPNITLVKNVDGGAALPTEFIMRIGGFAVPHTGSRSVDSNTPITISEDAFTGYSITSIDCDNGNSSAGPTLDVTLDEGEAIECTITNTEID